MAASTDEEETSKRRPQNLVADREEFTPSGRPLNYQGGRNWETRIATRTAYGVAIGALVGLGVGLYKRQTPFTWLRSMGADYGIATCMFCSFQELTREIRAADPDDWANCFLGGLASGALLGRIHGGPARALPTAVLFASVGTGVNFGVHLYKEYRLRHLLPSKSEHQSTVGSLDMESTHSVSVETGPTISSWFDFELPEWFPIQKLNEDEAKRRHAERENNRRNALESLQAGTLPGKDQ